MNRRYFKRNYVKLHARFFFEDTMHTCTISNLSANGMYIEMDMCLYYYKSRFNVQLVLINGVLEIPVKVSRFLEAYGFYYGMGVEVLDPPKQYLDVVASLGSPLTLASSEYHAWPV